MTTLNNRTFEQSLENTSLYSPAELTENIRNSHNDLHCALYLVTNNSAPQGYPTQYGLNLALQNCLTLKEQVSEFSRVRSSINLEMEESESEFLETQSRIESLIRMALEKLDENSEWDQEVHDISGIAGMAEELMTNLSIGFLQPLEMTIN